MSMMPVTFIERIATWSQFWVVLRNVRLTSGWPGWLICVAAQSGLDPKSIIPAGLVLLL